MARIMENNRSEAFEVKFQPLQKPAHLSTENQIFFPNNLKSSQIDFKIEIDLHIHNPVAADTTSYRPILG